MSEFKVFRMNEFDTVAARSEAEATGWYKRETGCTDDDLDEEIWEVPESGLTWDYVDPFTTPAKEYIELKSKVITGTSESGDTDAIIDGKRYTIICGDLFVESTYGELLKRIDPKEPMILTTSEW